ncbi:MAG: 4-hydroxyphenylpyruvate dioxygenase [Bacteriovorax sp.]
MFMINNPAGLLGIEFIEFVSPDKEMLNALFLDFGFSKTMGTANLEQDHYKQSDIHFIINNKLGGHSEQFKKVHGPSISAMAFRVDDAQKALEASLGRGAKEASGEYLLDGKKIPAIYGIGDSIIYFVDQYKNEKFYNRLGFQNLPNPSIVKDKGFISIDHLTNNVEKGTMQTWANFYKNIFGFTEVRYFDIKGVKTGLVSYALKSPCGTFCIPINEGTDKKSQINEYLEEYKGPGIQHLAFLTNDILKSLDLLEGKIKTLDIDDDYYDTVFDRVPNVSEDRVQIKKHNILVDGDAEGYLLQIFTKNIVGPIFVEIIQRKNHLSFGEGNFGALFRSIEKDQEKRGYLD